MENNLLIIAGPTASGKTSLAAELAREWDTGVISADSRQMYREMRIGTARPGEEEMAGVPHYFLGNLAAEQYYNASMFEQDVLSLLDELFPTHPLVIMAGGSGLYIHAVCFGIDDLPRVDPALRQELKKKYEEEGLRPLQDLLLEKDPVSYAQVDLNNPKRVLKALEISIMTGRPYSGFLTRTARERPFGMIPIGLDLPREELYDRINRRVDRMVEQGLVEEARKLFPLRHLNALNTVGYQELFDHFLGRISLEEAIGKIKDHTRQYARKQITWFRKMPGITWFHPDQRAEIRRHIQKQLR